MGRCSAYLLLESLPGAEINFQIFDAATPRDSETSNVSEREHGGPGRNRCLQAKKISDCYVIQPKLHAWVVLRGGYLDVAHLKVFHVTQQKSVGG